MRIAIASDHAALELKAALVQWLGEAGHGAARLMQPTPAGSLVARRVGRAVNSNRADGPQLIEENAD